VQTIPHRGEQLAPLVPREIELDCGAACAYLDDRAGRLEAVRAPRSTPSRSIGTGREPLVRPSHSHSQRWARPSMCGTSGRSRPPSITRSRPARGPRLRDRDERPTHLVEPLRSYSTGELTVAPTVPFRSGTRTICRVARARLRAARARTFGPAGAPVLDVTYPADRVPSQHQLRPLGSSTSGSSGRTRRAVASWGHEGRSESERRPTKSALFRSRSHDIPRSSGVTVPSVSCPRSRTPSPAQHVHRLRRPAPALPSAPRRYAPTLRRFDRRDAAVWHGGDAVLRAEKGCRDRGAGDGRHRHADDLGMSWIVNLNKGRLRRTALASPTCPRGPGRKQLVGSCRRDPMCYFPRVAAGAEGTRSAGT